MSQQQPQRPQQAQAQSEPVKYGDVFPVQGELANQPIKPQDAAMMQTAENLVLGQTQKGGPAAVMQSASTYNERAGLVGHQDASPVPADQGVSVTETDLPAGRRVITESIAGQVVGKFEMPAPLATYNHPAGALEGGAVTIGEALEASALTAGDKPVDRCDAAAIQAAEMRATGRNVIVPGGVAAAAQSAADTNARVMSDELKTKLGDVLADATSKLPADKVVTREDAAGVAAAEMRNNPSMETTLGGVAASVAAAARLNQNK
ncbi:late embryogenesis abundant protein D-34-like [Iris pallida]|nr:late embryogenesis abundant protein D-34-like [Iris pallida]